MNSLCTKSLKHHSQIQRRLSPFLHRTPLLVTLTAHFSTHNTPSPDQLCQDGFSRVADQYDQSRPSYPKKATYHLLNHVTPSTSSDSPLRIIDLGAGTGKFTSLLKELYPNDNITAVEPVEKFRNILTAKFGSNSSLQITVLNGNSHNLSDHFDDNSVNLITCAQCFHWFANVQSLRQFQKLLIQNEEIPEIGINTIKNGSLFLIWNRSKYDTCDFVRELKQKVINLYHNETQSHVKYLYC